MVVTGGLKHYFLLFSFFRRKLLKIVSRKGAPENNQEGTEPGGHYGMPRGRFPFPFTMRRDQSRDITITPNPGSEFKIRGRTANNFETTSHVLIKRLLEEP